MQHTRMGFGVVVAALLLAGPSVVRADEGVAGVVQPEVRAGAEEILRSMGLKGGRLVDVAAQSMAGSSSVTITLDMGTRGAPRIATLDMAPFALRAPDFKMFVSGADGKVHEAIAPAPSSFHGRDRATGDQVWASIIDGRVRGVVLPAGGGEAIAYIQPVENAGAALHAVYAPGDAIGTDHTCGVDDCPECIAHAPAGGNAGDFGPRGGSCKYVELVAEADYPLYQANGDSAARTVQDVETVMLGVNGIYGTTASFTSPVRLALKAVTVWTTSAGDPYNALPLVDANSGTMLSTCASRWAAIPSPVHDIVHLFTGRDLNGSTIGLAYVPGMCSSSSGAGLSQTRFSTVLAARYAVTAHEIGHNFGMSHDASSGFIMASSVNPGSPATTFSAASVATYNANIGSYACLNNTWPDVLPDGAVTLPGVPVLIDVLGNDGQGVVCATAVTSFTLGSGSTTLGGTASVSVGTGPGGRNQVLYTPPGAASGVEDTFNYTAGGVSAPVYVTVLTPRPPDQPYQSVLSGLGARYYDIRNANGSVTLYGSMPDVASYPQFGTGTPALLNYPPTTGSAVGSTRNFGVGAIFEGYIQVPQTAFYQFWLASDDLSRLFVGSTPVVDNRSVGSAGEATGTIALAPGRHKILVDYTQYSGTSTLVLSYAYGAQPRITVPASALWRASGACPGDFNGADGLTVQDIFDFLNDWFAGAPRADFNGVDGLSVQDIFDFLNVWFGGC